MRCKAENLHSDLHPPIHAGGQHRTRSGSGKRRPAPGTCRKPEAGHMGDTSRIGRVESRDRLKCCAAMIGEAGTILPSAPRRADFAAPMIGPAVRIGGLRARATVAIIPRTSGPRGLSRARTRASGPAPPAWMPCRASWPAAMTPPRSPGRTVGGLPGNRDGLGDRIIAILLELLQGGSRLFLLPTESDCGAVPDQPAS